MQIDALWKKTFSWWFAALAMILYSWLLVVAIAMGVSHRNPFSTVEMIVVPIGAATLLALVLAGLITNGVDKEEVPDFARAWDMRDSTAQAKYLLRRAFPIGLGVLVVAWVLV